MYSYIDLRFFGARVFSLTYGFRFLDDQEDV